MERTVRDDMEELERLRTEIVQLRKASDIAATERTYLINEFQFRRSDNFRLREEMNSMKTADPECYASARNRARCGKSCRIMRSNCLRITRCLVMGNELREKQLLKRNGREWLKRLYIGRGERSWRMRIVNE
ncbi:hypothetical protein ACMFMG_005592 [Clarireedia jacksonii]